MAHIATHVETSARSGLRDVLAAIGRGIVAIGENNTRMRAITLYQNMTDAELAARGLKREDIARNVFRDVYFL
ncbi:DUF1127 domain-containing protein [Mesobacterium sp. TK19101]|uniref:DUF1127 domain-containing protein n=1 Tax=Mesobacterium hydrothermale TaxID=3111907 RepID=A0ABU6HEJ7_9RHOB|nr:DUF1127 domain-containing protein [Mesobacterium sp. TK19101]MEC3860893.1 DUF1127 domain-containing protein [Mesobacterium sp. TK19101]